MSMGGVREVVEPLELSCASSNDEGRYSKLHSLMHFIAKLRLELTMEWHEIKGNKKQ